jgi:hypothetical protein
MPSSSANIRTIRRFLEGALQQADKIEVVIFHLDISNRKSAVLVRKWDGVQPPLEEFSSEIFEGAKSHCGVLGGPQRFMLSAFDVEDETEHRAPVHNAGMVVEGGYQLGTDGEMATSEPPTQEGLLAHLMRHNNEQARLNTSAMGAMIAHLVRMVESQGAQIDGLLRDKISTVQVVEDLFSRKADREIAAERSRAESKRRDELLAKILQLGPMILNKVTGKELVRQHDSALEASVIAFMESITPSTLDSIAKSNVFTERQLVMIATMLEQVTKRMVTVEEKKQTMETAERAAVGDIVGDAVRAGMEAIAK